MNRRAAGFQFAKRLSVQTASRMLAPLIEIGNYDFCPWANRYVDWLKRPIGWFLVGTAAAALTAVFLEPRAWIVFGSLVAVMLIGVVWPWIAIRGASAEIAFDCRRCREGDRVKVRLTIVNRWPWPLWGLAVENGFFVSAGEAGERPVAALARVAGWSRSEFVFEFQPGARGVYPHSAPELASGFPFGLWRASSKVSLQRELLAWPRTTPLTSIPSLGGDIADVIGMLCDRSGNEGDVLGVRPYRDGDRLRSIHWAQTARRESLIVTERQAAARRLVVVAVDVDAFLPCGQLPACRQASNGQMAGWKPSPRNLEIAIRVAASIAQEFHAHHAEVRFVIGDVDLRLSPDSAGLHRLLDALANFRVERTAAQRPGNFGQQALTIVVTSGSRRAEWEAVAGTRDSLRMVLLDGARENGNVWMSLDSQSDTSNQLRQQWERVCHDN